jgi:hypothetical protein
VSKFIEMDYDDFVQTYKPIINHLDDNASFDGYMFETYGEEVEFVKSQDPAKIWMYGDGDGGSYIWSGWGFVNRIGYFITEVPCPEDTLIQIQVSIPWYFCETCHTEWEDENYEISDIYSELNKCPKCATLEELKTLQDEEQNA